MQKGLSSGCEIGRMGDLVDPFLDAGEGTGSDGFVGKDAEPAKGKLSGAYGWHGCPEQEGPQDRREPGLRCGGGNHRYSPEKAVQSHRQSRLRAFQSLALVLFVDVQHERVRRRVQACSWPRYGFDDFSQLFGRPVRIPPSSCSLCCTYTRTYR